MERRKQLAEKYPIRVCLFASPTYWPEAKERAQLYNELDDAIGHPELFSLSRIESENDVDNIDSFQGPIVAVALSGGVQPWMLKSVTSVEHVAILNAYLPEAFPSSLSGRLMHANAHPASTDFFAACRMGGKNVSWLTGVDELVDYAEAWQGVQRLAHARILKIGETEPWVINSCRDPERVKKRTGCEVVAVERGDLYEVFDRTSDEEVMAESGRWHSNATELETIIDADIVKASRVTRAMKKILKEYDADGLSMACFAMIGDIDTTSCLALSTLNDSAYEIGACEGDLDAAVTLFLLKAMGADFVWIANPIIHANNTIDLVHCTAPTCACGIDLNYKLMRHHESGRGVSPEVELPSGRVASAVRIGINSGAIVCHVGETKSQSRLPACNTQIQLMVESTDVVIDTLLGTHLVLSYGDFGRRIEYAADFMGFDSTITRKPRVNRLEA